MIKGAGDLASGIALRLHRCGFRVMMTEIAVPTTVRRTVAFSPAVYLGKTMVEDVEGVLCETMEVAEQTLNSGKIAVLVDEQADIIRRWRPDVVVDSILAKKNLGTKITDAPTVIGVGPGFTAGVDCHCVVETKRGHYLGRCIWDGAAIPNSGVPGLIGGYGIERLIRATADGSFRGAVAIGDTVKAGDVVGYVETGSGISRVPIQAQIDGVVRGILQDGVPVKRGMKSGDVDPRCEVKHCFTVSDKASSIGGGVLEAILRHKMMRQQEAEPLCGRSTALVLLAAGDSRRFQGNKLLAQVEGKPMYRHIVDEIAALPAETFTQKIVVSQYPTILDALYAEGYDAVENQESSLGISHSIHLALGTLKPSITSVCFAVCDQPWLKGETIKGLLDGWQSSKKGMGCLFCHGEYGNPGVFSSEYFPELKALSGDVGGRRIMKHYPEDLYCFEVEHEREMTDLDYEITDGCTGISCEKHNKL